ncbi:hypothetical protein [Azospirillum doebereinerae]
MDGTGTTFVNLLWMLAIVGGPIVLALVLGYGILKRRRNRMR